MDCCTPGFSVHHYLPELAQTSCPLSWWCHPTILSSVTLFSCLQSFPASRSFPMSQYFASGCQSIGVSASASVLPMNIQDGFPWGLTGLASLQSKGLSRVFSNITVQKCQFFGAQPSLGFPSVSVGKDNCLQYGRPGLNPWVGKIPWRREQLLSLVFWPRESMDCIVHGVAKNRPPLSDFHFHILLCGPALTSIHDY